MIEGVYKSENGTSDSDEDLIRYMLATHSDEEDLGG